MTQEITNITMGAKTILDHNNPLSALDYKNNELSLKYQVLINFLLNKLIFFHLWIIFLIKT